AALEVGAILERVRETRNATSEAVPRVRVQTASSAYNGSNTWPVLMCMLAMAVFVLLLACVNVANLLFVRADERMRELALRNALGAGTGRIVRQLLLESLVLAALGATVGIALAAGAVRVMDYALRSMLSMPTWMYFDLNPRVLLLTVAVSAFAGLVA